VPLRAKNARVARDAADGRGAAIGAGDHADAEARVVRAQRVGAEASEVRSGPCEVFTKRVCKPVVTKTEAESGVPRVASQIFLNRC
jgi:hypothetical protein